MFKETFKESDFSWRITTPEEWNTLINFESPAAWREFLVPEVYDELFVGFFWRVPEEVTVYRIRYMSDDLEAGVIYEIGKLKQ